VFDRKSDAMHRGRELARSERTELVAHGRDGRIQEKDSFGHDRAPPREGRSGPKGYGSLGGEFLVRKGINISKPIYEQAIRGEKKDQNTRKR
jgi:hypothetical protein